MKTSIVKVAVAIALVCTTGLHWVGLQTVAWTTMLASNLGTDGFTEAVSNTFDGRHPCPLCKMIAAGKKSERKTEAAQLKFKLEYPPTTRQLLFVASDAYENYGRENTCPPRLNVKPLHPPPEA